jgi:hypothetical protein
MKEKTLRGAMSTVAIGLVACSRAVSLLNSKGSVGIAERNLIATSTWKTTHDQQELELVHSTGIRSGPFPR